MFAAALRRGNFLAPAAPADTPVPAPNGTGQEQMSGAEGAAIARISVMAVTFADKLARMPSYQAGVPTGIAPEASGR